jgi:tRNA threonylcarbamoyladenosine biosynthesis protein TsaB
MALILQLETSTSSCSVALALDGKTLALKELDERNAHASHLTLFIEDVLQTAEKKMSDLDAVAVSMGPGSYTGLRIGVSTAKGLCYALDIPLLAISTLESMASGFKANFKSEASFFCPMIDARRMEVYSAVYNSEIKEVLPVAARIIDADSFNEILEEEKIVFFGDGAMKCETVLSKFPNGMFVSDFVNSAKDMSELAYKKYIIQQFEDVAYFEPFYLKDFLIIEPKTK